MLRELIAAVEHALLYDKRYQSTSLGCELRAAALCTISNIATDIDMGINYWVLYVFWMAVYEVPGHRPLALAHTSLRAVNVLPLHESHLRRRFLPMDKLKPPNGCQAVYGSRFTNGRWSPQFPRVQCSRFRNTVSADAAHWSIIVPR